MLKYYKGVKSELRAALKRGGEGRLNDRWLPEDCFSFELSGRFRELVQVGQRMTLQKFRLVVDRFSSL
jgi:hypothetical protein